MPAHLELEAPCGISVVYTDAAQLKRVPASQRSGQRRAELVACLGSRRTYTGIHISVRIGDRGARTAQLVLDRRVRPRQLPAQFRFVQPREMRMGLGVRADLPAGGGELVQLHQLSGISSGSCSVPHQRSMPRQAIGRAPSM